MTQCEKIYKALKSGRTLTQLSIFKLCGSLNGHKRIWECAQKNQISIVFGWRVVNGNRIRTYKLA